MRALLCPLFILSLFPSPARARESWRAPALALSIAADWNKFAAEPPDETRARTVEARVRTAEARLESYTRLIVVPEANPSLHGQRNRMLRRVYARPFSPYLGCYGVMLTLEGDLTPARE